MFSLDLTLVAKYAFPQAPSHFEIWLGGSEAEPPMSSDFLAQNSGFLSF